MDQVEMFDNEGMWLAKLRSKWNKSIEGDGSYCPCCGKWGKVYRYKLSQSLALALKWIHDHGDEDGWVDVQKKAPRWMLKSKSYPTLQHWRLIEAKTPRSGIWRATEEGRNFLRGSLVMPEAMFVYDNTIWGRSDDHVSFRECFGKHFDFDDLMSDRFNWAGVK